MSSISEKLELLRSKLEKVKSDRAAIINAIREKGVSIPQDILLEDIPPYIMAISGGGETDINKVIDEVLYLVDNIGEVSGEKLTLSTGTVTNEKLTL